MKMIFILELLVFFSLLATGAEAEETGKPLQYESGDTSVAGNMRVKGVPDEFMLLIRQYIQIGSDDVPTIERIEKGKIQLEEIINTIKKTYPHSAESYFLLIVKNNKNSYVRNVVYRVFLKTGLNNGAMLRYSRDALLEQNWSGGSHLDVDIKSRMRVLIAYGDDSDLELWNEIWAKLDQHEKNAFKNYRKMLIKALDKKDSLTRTRAARGEKGAEQKLLGEEPAEVEIEPSVFKNKQFIIGGIVAIILFLIYLRLRIQKARNASCS